MNQDLFDRPSTDDTGTRNTLDYYETPSWMVQSLLRHHDLSSPGFVLEPCAGDGSIARVLRAAGLRVLTNDIDQRHDADRHDDATRFEFWDGAWANDLAWVVSNLPFNRAFDIVRHALGTAVKGVAILLRKSFLEPTVERGEWLAAHPPTRVIGLPRHSFRGRGSDTVSCDWMIWELRRRSALAPFVIDAIAKMRRSA